VSFRERSRRFIGHLADYGQIRYIERPFHVTGRALLDLDVSVWELRRYCEVLNVFGKVLPAREQALLAKALSDLAKSSSEPKQRFRLHSGFLEGVLKKSDHPARPALLWNNAMFASRKRATVKVREHLTFTNPVLSNYPQMLDELLEYSPLPRELVRAYREQQAEEANDQRQP
jgi:hypothetical protein